MKITRHIPNAITSLNLFAGSIATYYAFKGEFEITFFAVILAAFFDFLDGFAARLLKAYSPMGKELDSLADVISFGMAPGAIVFSMLEMSDLPSWVSFVGFIIPVFSALRLAKFNIDERQTDSFIGMPTPANALFWIGISFSFAGFLAEHPWVLLIATVVFSLLLVSEIPMIALKFKGLDWKQNSSRYLFLGGCVVLLIGFQFNAVWMIILWYTTASIFLPARA
jgi:CDP-diacylglycerol--serine O-phosphatidyltransferase